MLVIVAAAMPAVSISSGPRRCTDAIGGGGVSRTAAACSGVRPAARSPLSRARLGRSTLTQRGQLGRRRGRPLARSSAACRRRTRRRRPARRRRRRGRRRRRARRSRRRRCRPPCRAARCAVDARRRRRVRRPRRPGSSEPPPPRLAMTMIAARATALMISVTSEACWPASPRGSRAWRRAQRRALTPAIGDVSGGGSTVSVLGGPADGGEEHLGQAAPLEGEVVHRPGPAGGVEHRLRPVRPRCPAPAAAASCRTRPLRIADDVDRRLAELARPAARRGRRAPRSPAPGRLPAVRSSIVPSATTRPRSTMMARSHRSSTRSSWWDENSTVAPRRASPTSTLDSASTATGSRPENGSSSISTSGSWSSALISWTRCWLPSDRSSSCRRPDRRGRARRASGGPRGRATLRSMPRSCAEEAQLLGDLHRRVEAALLGQVAEAAAHLEVDRPAVEAHAARRRGR